MIAPEVVCKRCRHTLEIHARPTAKCPYAPTVFKELRCRRCTERVLTFSMVRWSPALNVCGPCIRLGL